MLVNLILHLISVRIRIAIHISIKIAFIDLKLGLR